MCDKYNISSLEKCGLFPEMDIDMATSDIIDILKQSANRIVQGEVPFSTELFTVARQLCNCGRIRSSLSKRVLVNNLRVLVKKADVENRYTWLYNHDDNILKILEGIRDDTYVKMTKRRKIKHVDQLEIESFQREVDIVQTLQCISAEDNFRFKQHDLLPGMPRVVSPPSSPTAYFPPLSPLAYEKHTISKLSDVCLSNFTIPVVESTSSTEPTESERARMIWKKLLKQSLLQTRLS